jgi:hypothetical protein
MRIVVLSRILGILAILNHELLGFEAHVFDSKNLICAH